MVLSTPLEPRISTIVPIVSISELSPSLTVSSPLITPNSSTTISASPAAATKGKPDCISQPASAPLKPYTAPAERSISPSAIT